MENILHHPSPGVENLVDPPVTWWILPITMSQSNQSTSWTGWRTSAPRCKPHIAVDEFPQFCCGKSMENPWEMQKIDKLLINSNISRGALILKMFLWLFDWLQRVEFLKLDKNSSQCQLVALKHPKYFTTPTLQWNVAAFSTRPFSTNAIYKVTANPNNAFFEATPSTLPFASFDPPNLGIWIIP